MLELLVVSTPFVAAGFGAGYIVRDCISRRRHREAARRYGYGARGSETFVRRPGAVLP